jgi:hypothetical protein
MFSAMLAACLVGQIPFTLNVSTTSSYGNGTITWDGSSKWVGTLSRPFRYEAYPDGIPRVCGTASGTAKVRVEMDMTGLLILSWDSTNFNVCAVDGGGGGTGGAYRNTRVYAVTSQTPFKAAVAYNAFSDTLPPFFGFATLTVSAP